jgi:uncharacterized protein (TIGR00297 family)
MPDWTQPALALLLSLLIAALGYWRQWLSPSGVAGAILVGTLTMGFGGWAWGMALAVFFVSSSLLSRFRAEQKQQTAAEKFDKGSRRDLMQALANGGVGALAALLSVIFPSPFWLPFFLGVMGTVTADTWATELGTLSRRPPRLITTGRPVEVGTSGGISPLGTAVSLAGGVLIGVVTGLFGAGSWWYLAILAGVGGLAGSLIDSLLGATVQRIWWDDVKQKETEKRFKYGREMQPLRGLPWLNNDLVNLLSSLAGGLVAVAIFALG